jgi:type II secretory pathway component PulF
MFLVVLVTGYGTKALFEDSGIECRDNNDPNTFKWWVISVITLVYGWGYSLLLLIGLTSLPLIIIFWCFYRMQMSEIENESRLQNIPVAGEIIRTLNRQKY